MLCLSVGSFDRSLFVDANAYLTGTGMTALQPRSAVAVIAALAVKCLTTPPFWVLLGFEPITIVGRHQNSEKAHPWARTRHLSHKRLKSVHWCDLSAIARKKYNQDRT